jgi:3-isopropylmalate dehydratase small subunit
MTIIEKILASHAGKARVKPGDIVDVAIDVRLARDFGGAGVIKNLQSNNLVIHDPNRTFFTFDCNPTGSDQQYAANQQKCRVYARENHIRVYDINAGIGTHLAMEEGLAVPGSTLVSTDSHANIVGAIGAFGQGMGDRDIAAAWARGAVWFKVPESVKITLMGERSPLLKAKDIALNLLKKFGADSLLGCAVELYGDEVEKLSLDERITISSMATEMGAITVIFPPSEAVIAWCQARSYAMFSPVYADLDTTYLQEYALDIGQFAPAVSMPGQPHDVSFVKDVHGTKIDSVFIGSCTNGRMEDMREAARILHDRKTAPGVVLKIVPATDEIWNACLHEGIIDIFKAAGALFGNAGCAGCASGQIGQNGPGERTVSTGNRNFEGKQGKGEVYLASVATAAASAVAGHLTTEDDIPDKPSVYAAVARALKPEPQPVIPSMAATILEGRVWLVERDNIDTDMIYHNQHLAITDIRDMGKYTFGNLAGWKDFASRAAPGDIVIAGRNFGSGSSRQQAVDCFRSLQVQAILAMSFGAIYERNAINAGFPVLTYTSLHELDLENGDMVSLDLERAVIINKKNGKQVSVSPFSEVQMMIYRKGDLLRM